MPMLASDLINPAFVGARNPDELLAVEFYWGIVKDMRGRPALDKDGKERKCPFIRISVPGNDTSMVDTYVREEHKVRFKRQWDFWQAQEEQGREAPSAGWALADWDEINDEQRRELKYLRFTVVEQLAQASDATLQRVGPDGMALRNKARKALSRRVEEAQAREIAARDKQINDLQASMAAIQAQLAAMSPKPEVIEEPQKRRPGRPPKAKTEAEVI